MGYLDVRRVFSPSKRVKFALLSKIEIAEIALIALCPYVNEDGGGQSDSVDKKQDHQRQK
jgi:hypothetical protein